MKKTIMLSIIGISIIGFFSACKKSDPSPTIVGFWAGKYSFNNTNPSHGYAFLFRSNGTVRVFDASDTTTLTNASKAEGTYSISGSTVTATYKYTGASSSFSTSCTVNMQYTFLSGTWGTTPSVTSGGFFYLVKQ